MEIGAVALLGITGIEHVTASPACAGFIVTQGRKHVIVDGAGLVERRRLSLGDFHGQFRWHSSCRHERIRREILLLFAIAYPHGLKMRRINAQRDPLMADDVVNHFEMQARLLGFRNFGVVHFISVFRLMGFL